ncbi:UDP-N-acetylglucosamine 2-epimerase [Serinibacter salmoneus]|uniref:UDP-N-acetylglucosamine 2-epimerase (Non-hydrolysing) n=1 Tax=Serinibacter salmoneus TaxID=556530 RepID=A0A2A9CWU1_9MICO|nr:UDP-N-acetylglucosamine 2-epimerase [Serinibacter salmoneus]PFG18606.1 UDP-N-acetylglucosamine 2-epimerase (non-hydrolysing) [Serinibacter salmoneus]
MYRISPPRRGLTVVPALGSGARLSLQSLVQEPRRAFGDVAVVLDVRPQFIKLASVIKVLGERARVVQACQHRDQGSAGQFLRKLGLGEPDVTLDGVHGADRAQRIGRGIIALTEHLEAHPAQVIVVQGDTDSTRIGAQVGSRLGVPVIHVDAGLSSQASVKSTGLDRLRVAPLVDLHCAATPGAVANLLAEGVAPRRVRLTGNALADVTTSASALQYRRWSEIAGAGVRVGGYVLAPILRPETTNSPVFLQRILHALGTSPIPVLMMVRPRTLTAIGRLDPPTGAVRLRAAVCHSDYLELARRCALVVSDSSEVQEEAAVLGKPVLVISEASEHPEFIAAGFARLATREVDLVGELAECLKRRAFPALEGARSTDEFGRAASLIADAARALAAGEEPAGDLMTDRLLAGSGSLGGVR